MTLYDKIADILRPAIDVNAPYAKQMIAALTELIGFAPASAAEKDETKADRSARQTAEARVENLVADVTRLTEACRLYREDIRVATERAGAAEARVKELEEEQDKADAEQLLFIETLARAEKAEAQLAPPVAGEVEELATALDCSIVTASNDDISEANTEKRKRHVARLEAMRNAAALLRRFGRVPKLETETEYAWLIEWPPRNDKAALCYYGGMSWPTTAFEAIHFARREDADAVREHLDYIFRDPSNWPPMEGSKYRVAEHGFDRSVSHISADGATEVENG